MWGPDWVTRGCLCTPITALRLCEGLTEWPGAVCIFECDLKETTDLFPCEHALFLDLLSAGMYRRPQKLGLYAQRGRLNRYGMRNPVWIIGFGIWFEGMSAFLNIICKKTPIYTLVSMPWLAIHQMDVNVNSSVHSGGLVCLCRQAPGQKFTLFYRSELVAAQRRGSFCADL